MFKLFIHISIVIFLSFLCYIKTLNGNFVFDDIEAVVKNKDVLVDQPWENLLKNDFWGTSILKNHSHKSYRPITVLSFRLNNYLSNDKKPSPFYYHLVNVILYTIVCSLFYFVFKIFYESVIVSTNCDTKTLAFLTDILFIVHPIHVECVSAIVGRADLLCAIFYLLAFIFYYCTINRKHKILFFTLTITCTTVSMFCKETGITVLGFCIMFDLFYNRRDIRKMHRHYLFYKASIFNSLFPIVLRIITMTVIACGLLYARWWVMDFRAPNFQEMDNPASFHPQLLTRLLTYYYMYALNSLLLIWPEWLCFDWAMGCIPLVDNLSDFRVLFVILFMLTFCAFCYKIYTNIYNSELYIPIAFITVSFLPASNIIRVGFVVAERQLLIPSAGFCMLIVIGFAKLKQLYPKMAYILYVTLVLVFAGKVQIRSGEWLMEKTLYNSALSVCPNNAKVHYNIAKIASDEGDVKTALTEYRKAISLYPKYDHAMNNLANLLRDMHQYNESEILLKRSLSIRPEFAAAWMNLGIVQMNKKLPKEAENSFMTALSHRPNYADCYYNLGNLYLEETRHSEALKAWKSAIQIQPLHTVAWSNLLILLDSLGRTEEAILIGYQAVKILPKEPALHFNLANSLGKARRWRDAEYHFTLAINLNPNNALYYSNLGVLYHRWNKLEEAANYYRIALKLDPTLKSAKANLIKISK